MPKVSVIIPVYNGQEFIAATLETVFSQTFTDFEVIVVNDGSTDETVAVLQNFREKITLMENSHRGPGSSRNLGLQASSGSLIAFLDADDLWLPQKLDRQVAVANLHPEFGIITTDMSRFDASGITERSSGALKGTMRSGYVLEEILLDNWIWTSCAMVRRECFEKVGNFDDQSIAIGRDDWNMWVRIAVHYPVFYLNEILVHYRVHARSFSHQDHDKLLAGWLAELDRLEESVPQLRARHELMEEARFRRCWSTGWDSLRALHIRGAQDKLRLALRYSPYDAKTWVALGAAYLPTPILRSLRSISKAAVRATRSIHS